MHQWLPWAIGTVAFLYAAVGHAGATGYVAVMALAGVAPAGIRPTALALNVVVAFIGTVQFTRAGHQRVGVLLPLAVASAPCAWLGGGIALPTAWLEGVLGAVLAVSAVCQWRQAAVTDGATPPAVGVPRRAGPARLIGLGAVIGLLSGITGVGGGIFLTPALLALRIAPLKTVAAVTAPFILLNSLAGLAGGGAPTVEEIDPGVVTAAVIGGMLGSQAGAFQLPGRALRRLLAFVLGIASVKMVGACLAALSR